LPSLWLIVALALFLGGLDQLLTAHRTLDLLDESYLWYGVWRTSLGEVPIRDFQAYFPLRYYWGGLFVWLFGDGIVAMRCSGIVLKVLMVVVGLLVLRRRIRAWPVLVGMALVMMAWAYTFEKAAGYLIGVTAIWLGTRLIEQPSLRRHLVAGVFVGAAALVGRNHGVYTLLAFSLLIAFVWWHERKDLGRRAGSFAAGVGLGFSPLLLMMLALPGYGAAIWTNLLALFNSMAGAGQANLGRAIPWPWRIDYGATNWSMGAENLIFGVLLVLLAALPLGAALTLAVRRCPNLRDNAPLYAALAVSVAYIHYCYSRADITHLADAIQPFLVLLVLVPFALAPGPWRRGMAGVSGVVLLSAFALILSVHPTAQRFKHPSGFKQVEVRGDLLWMKARHAGEIAGVRAFIDELVQEGEGVLFAPYRPGMYLITDRKSPLKSIYFLSRKEESDQQMIAAMRANNVRSALLTINPIDGRRDLSFPVLHRELYQFLTRYYRQGDPAVWGLPRYYQVFRAPN